MAAFNPQATGMQFHWFSLFYMCLWGIGAMIIALRFFTWEPKTGGSRTSRKAKKAAATS